jgi:GNAT superfamily N-acetyltransferase
MRVRETDAAGMIPVLERSHEVWGEGAALDAYLAFNVAQRRSRWARKRYRFLVGEAEDGTLLAGLKWYAFPAAIDGEARSAMGLGAVFTPKEVRGRGHASVLVEAALERGAAQGYDLALLMSEIGAPFYERLGFRTLPAEEAACLPFLPVPWPAEPAWVAAGEPAGGLRPFATGDLDALVAIREEGTRDRRFRLRRDRLAWEQVLLKIELLKTFQPDRPHRVRVVERQGVVVAYAAWRRERAAIRWLEHGARGGADDALAGLFFTALREAREAGVNRLEAWHLPEDVSAPRLYPIAVRPRRDPVVMVRGLNPGRPVPEFRTAAECRLSWLDQF